jgi:AcrR family transcriptional regulator
MSPRPRKVTDQQLFAAARAVMSKVGPRKLTLAAIANEAGVTAAVLVQRFGSKRSLLLALFEEVANGASEFMAALAKQHASPLAALFAYADCMAGMAASPAAVARNLAYLQIDLTDPDFRRHLVKQARATRAALRRLVQAAVQAGELARNVQPTPLARTVEATMNGSMLTWAFYQQGTAAQWIRADLNAVLAPYLRKRRGSGIATQ